MATKSDLNATELALRRDIKELGTRLEVKMREFELRSSRELKELELRLTVRLGVVMAAGVGVIALLIKLV